MYRPGALLDGRPVARACVRCRTADPGVVAEVRAVRGIDAFDVHVVVQVFPHRGELLAVAVGEQHGDGPVSKRYPSPSVERLERQRPPVSRFFRDGHVVAGVREARRHAEPPTPPPTMRSACRQPRRRPRGGGSARLARTPARDERAGERRHVVREDAGTRAWANIARLCRGVGAKVSGARAGSRGTRGAI